MAVDLTDPVSTANASVVSSNIKNFGHSPDLILTTLMTDMVEAQRSMRQFNMGVLARATSLVLNDSADDVGTSILLQQGAKVAQTTPPETAVSAALAQIASTQALMVQMLQGMNIGPATK